MKKHLYTDDGTTLFFSSMGITPWAVMIFFTAVLSGNRWSVPVNLGYPLTLQMMMYSLFLQAMA
jgi:hypothetical protein